jgi:hypothetical protein
MGRGIVEEAAVLREGYSREGNGESPEGNQAVREA